LVHCAWETHLVTSVCELTFIPEEVPTPTSDHPSADVSRLAIQRAPRPEPLPADRIFAREAGRITAVSLLRAAVGFTPTEIVPVPSGRGPMESGVGYGYRFARPDSPAEPGPWFIADLGVVLRTETGGMWCVHTAAAYWTFVSTGGYPPELEGALREVPLLAP
jgi:hypothetical protein